MSKAHFPPSGHGNYSFDGIRWHTSSNFGDSNTGSPSSQPFYSATASSTQTRPKNQLSHSQPLVPGSWTYTPGSQNSGHDGRMAKVRHNSLPAPRQYESQHPSVAPQNTFPVRVRKAIPQNNPLVSRHPASSASANSTTTTLSQGANWHPMDTSSGQGDGFEYQPQPAPFTSTTPAYTTPTHSYSAPAHEAHPQVQVPSAFRPVPPSQAQEPSPPHSHSIQRLPPLPIRSQKLLAQNWKTNLSMAFAQQLEQRVRTLKNPNSSFHEKRDSLFQIITQLETKHLSIDITLQQDLLSYYALKMAFHLLGGKNGGTLNYHSTCDNQTLSQVLDYLKKSETNLQYQTGQNLWRNYAVNSFDDIGNYLTGSSVVLKDAKLAIRESLIAFLRSLCTLKMTNDPLSDGEINAASRALFFLTKSKKALEPYSQILDAELQADFSSLSLNQGILHQEIVRRLTPRPIAQNTPPPQNF